MLKKSLKDKDSKLHCNSGISSEFVYHLSQVCHNIQSLIIEFERIISNGLTDLISFQKNLKCFIIKQYDKLKDTSLLLEKLPNTLSKLNLSRHNYVSLSFIANFTNLKELELSFDDSYYFEDFEKLQYAIFPKLQSLKIRRSCPKIELIIKFLENNGKNLREFHVGDHEYDIRKINDNNNKNSLNLVIAKFCPNIRKLSTGFEKNELETLKIVLNDCKYLESIRLCCYRKFLSDKVALEAIINYSQKVFHELILEYFSDKESKLLPEELESFLTNWKNRIPKRSLSLVVITEECRVNSLDKDDENMKIINKYIKLGIIKKFKIVGFFDKEYGLWLELT